MAAIRGTYFSLGPTGLAPFELPSTTKASILFLIHRPQSSNCGIAGPSLASSALRRPRRLWETRYGFSIACGARVTPAATSGP